MTEPPPEPDRHELRRRAVERLESRRGDLADMPAHDVKALVHELEVHQVELEVQNEELRRVQLELAEALSQYQDLFEHAPVGYLTLNAEGKILKANRTAAKLCSREKETLEGERLETLALREDRGKCFLLVRGAAARGLPQAADLRVERPANHPRWLHVDVVPLASAKDVDGGYRAALIDITGRVAAEEALKQLNETLEERVAERTAVAEQRAEDLRRLAAELTDAEHRERTRLAKLLHDDLQQLLLAARLQIPAPEETGPKELAEGLARIDELLSSSLKTCRNLSQELSPPILRAAGLAEAIDWLAEQYHAQHGLTVAVAVVGNLPPEPEHLRVLFFQAARELLFNVVKHAGGADARVELSFVDGELQLRVDDTGTVFDPQSVWKQLERPKGLGLFQIRERLRALGGRLEVTRSASGGGRFRLAVPLPESAEPPPGPTVTDRGTARVDEGRPIRVLVADDHAVVREGFVGLLQLQPDFEVVGEADDGAGAVQLARSLTPDVILMDVNMPEVDGIEATRLIKQQQPGVVVVGLSLHEDEQVARAMGKAGGDAYISKNSAGTAVIDTVRKACGRSPAC